MHECTKIIYAFVFVSMQLGVCVRMHEP